MKVKKCCDKTKQQRQGSKEKIKNYNCARHIWKMDKFFIKKIKKVKKCTIAK